ncbi:MAG: NAD(P)/FAD-dependent oxidoreductase [Gammaproteobacteria bacterium]
MPTSWDAVVVGAGVAGSVSAWRLARGGLRVLLVEKARWPREKVCGGCVNAAAVRALTGLGLPEIATAGRGYSTMRLAIGRRQAVLPLPAGRAISRRHLDALLVSRAVEAGACFLPDTRATLEAAQPDARSVSLRQGAQGMTVTARVVLDCAGLGSRLTSDSAGAESHIAPGAYIGLGATIAAEAPFYRPGVIHMACGRHGYVGLVRVEDNQLNIGAALDPEWTKRRGGPAAAIAHILQGASFPRFDALRTTHWHGTPRLTRERRRLGGERVLTLGDAAGYVEPFTGEGMAWALAGAAAIEPFARAAVGHWQDDLVERWTARHVKLIRTRQRTCRGISLLLRQQWLSATLLPLISAAPGLVSPVTAWLNHDFPLHAMADE